VLCAHSSRSRIALLRAIQSGRTQARAGTGVWVLARTSWRLPYAARSSCLPRACRGRHRAGPTGEDARPREVPIPRHGLSRAWRRAYRRPRCCYGSSWSAGLGWPACGLNLISRHTPARMRSQRGQILVYCKDTDPAQNYKRDNCEYSQHNARSSLPHRVPHAGMLVCRLALTRTAYLDSPDSGSNSGAVPLLVYRCLL
jgi:hypothetical protein